MAIGHSWGLANITSAEVHGANYNKVISLAGAGMPPEWQPQAGTTYTDYSYWDFLMEAQSTGGVWGGRNPNRSDDFDSRGYFQSPHDVELEQTGDSYTPVWKLDDNHSLVAEVSEDNAQVRDALTDEIYKEQHD